MATPAKATRRSRKPKPRTAADQQALKQLGRRIAALRVEARPKLSADDLASKAGLARSYYRKLEQGIANPSALVLIALARALKCSVADMFRE